jgi:hypothetical protein
MDVNNNFEFDPNAVEFVPPTLRQDTRTNPTNNSNAVKLNGKLKKSKEARGPRKRRKNKRGKGDDEGYAPSEASESMESSDYSTISALCDLSKFPHRSTLNTSNSRPFGGSGGNVDGNDSTNVNRLHSFNHPPILRTQTSYSLLEDVPETVFLGDISKELSASTEENLNAVWLSSFLEISSESDHNNVLRHLSIDQRHLSIGQSFDNGLQLESHGQWLQLNQEWAFSKHRYVYERT